MPNYLLQAFASYKGTFNWLSWHSYLSAVILRPVALVIIFGLLGRFAADEARGLAFVIGISVYTIPMIIFGGVMQSLHDRSVCRGRSPSSSPPLAAAS